MGRRATTCVSLAAAFVAAVVWVLPAGAATTGLSPGQQTCAAPGGLDPDTVTLDGPATLAVDGHRTSYTLTAAESSFEQSGDPLPHNVSLTYSVMPGGSGRVLQSGAVSHDPAHEWEAIATFQLADTPPDSTREYVITWSASFDDGNHACSSSDGAHQPFVVAVAAPNS